MHDPSTLLVEHRPTRLTPQYATSSTGMMLDAQNHRSSTTERTHATQTRLDILAGEEMPAALLACVPLAECTVLPLPMAALVASAVTLGALHDSSAPLVSCILTSTILALSQS